MSSPPPPPLLPPFSSFPLSSPPSPSPLLFSSSPSFPSSLLLPSSPSFSFPPLDPLPPSLFLTTPLVLFLWSRFFLSSSSPLSSCPSSWFWVSLPCSFPFSPLLPRASGVADHSPSMCSLLLPFFSLFPPSLLFPSLPSFFSSLLFPSPPCPGSWSPPVRSPFPLSLSPPRFSPAWDR